MRHSRQLARAYRQKTLWRRLAGGGNFFASFFELLRLIVWKRLVFSREKLDRIGEELCNLHFLKTVARRYVVSRQAAAARRQPAVSQ